MDYQYDPERAEQAAKLWQELAAFEGEDADAQVMIEHALQDYGRTLETELNAASECIVERDNKLVELSEELERLREQLKAHTAHPNNPDQIRPSNKAQSAER